MQKTVKYLTSLMYRQDYMPEFASTLRTGPNSPNADSVLVCVCDYRYLGDDPFPSCTRVSEILKRETNANRKHTDL